MSWIYGTILDIDLRWYFNACPTCVRKVEPHGTKLWCNHCKEEVPFANAQYKLHMFIVDDTRIMQVLCWDKVANELIGKTCEEVVQNMIKYEDGSDLPIELSTLMDKALLFKVGKKKDQFRPYNGAFTVSRITADPILVHRFGVLETVPQVCDFEQGALNNPQTPRAEPVNDLYNRETKRKVSDEGLSCEADSKGKKKIKTEEI
ncbi:Unknown protein [Striga hermonthica]|uniref:Replication factor A C-terminal domain-containing protein n=1 Tax=Striga hermonthica TaxID=68872 RepID=A0A9N7MVQ9_STRHE|nr:Unknown protein [Striga hermonthica]